MLVAPYDRLDLLELCKSEESLLIASRGNYCFYFSLFLAANIMISSSLHFLLLLLSSPNELKPELKVKYSFSPQSCFWSDYLLQKQKWNQKIKYENKMKHNYKMNITQYLKMIYTVTQSKLKVLNYLKTFLMDYISDNSFHMVCTEGTNAQRDKN